MYHFDYVTKRQAAPYKANLIALINAVQNRVRDKFTFQFVFIGSSSRNMITFDPTTNIGFDFDVNIYVNDDDETYSPTEIRTALYNAFRWEMVNFGYTGTENSTRVFSIKKTDLWRSRILHSCDIAIVYDSRDGQQYIHLNKFTGECLWEFQPQPYKDLRKRADFLKKGGHWNEVLNLYLYKKNTNANPDKHSRSLYAETINECYARYRKSK